MRQSMQKQNAKNYKMIATDTVYPKKEIPIWQRSRLGLAFMLLMVLSCEEAFSQQFPNNYSNNSSSGYVINSDWSNEDSWLSLQYGSNKNWAMSNENGVFRWRYSTAFKDNNGKGTNHMSLSEDGVLNVYNRVAIGNTSATKTLTIRASSGYDGISFKNQNDIQVGVLAQDTPSLAGYFRLNKSDGMSSVFFVADENKRSYINGGLGIGIINPSKRLTVMADSIDYDGFFLLNRTGNTISEIAQDAGTNNGYLRINSGDGSPSALIMADPDKSSYIGSKFGVGTKSPGAMLHVVGDDNNGVNAALKVGSGSELMLIDGNEIDSNADFHINNNNSNKVTIANGGGNVGIGTANPTERLEVNGIAKATSFVSSAASFPDYVFESSYKIMPLNQLESFVKENKHLPNMPAEKGVVQNGLDLPEVLIKSVENIETIYLHLFELKKEIEYLKKENDELREKINK
jgi:hypothetical protein